MTNPTRTRAEIQAPPPEVIGNLAWDMKLIAMIGDAATTYKHTDEFAPYWSQILRLLDFVRTTTTADLIPREEHEAALIEANTRTDKVVLHLNALDAIRYLVKEYALDAPGDPRSYLHYHDGLEYRVTVERVDATPDSQADSMCIDAGPHTPVGPAKEALACLIWETSRRDEGTISGIGADKIADAIIAAGWHHPAPAKIDANTALKYLVKEYDLDTGHMDSARPRTYPFDHNGHVYEVVVRRKGEVVAPQAVAPVGVIEELRNASIRIAKYAESDMAKYGQANNDHEAALSRITELPEPSEWAKEAVEGGYPFCHRTVDELRDLAAALLSKEGDHEA